MLEGTMQYLVGNISKLGGMEKTAEKFLLNSNKVIENTFKSKAGQGILKYLLQQGIDSGGEFTQESMQSFLEPVLRNLIFGENNEIKLFTEEQLYSGLVGALTSIVANGAGKMCIRDRVWSRVVGYLRPVQNFHKGKKTEYDERVKYTIKENSI